MSTQRPTIGRVQGLNAHIRPLARSQLTASLATAVDMGTLVALVELAQVHYVAATAAGALCGALTNYGANRLWAFDDAHPSPVGGQMALYGAVSAGSLLLNTGGVFLFTDLLGFRYLLSKIITALAVGLLWNYPLHRFVVFRKEQST